MHSRHSGVLCFVPLFFLAAKQVPRVKYTFWNHDCSLVALASKHTIVIANKQLDQL